MLEGTNNEVKDRVVQEAKRKVVGVILCFTGFYLLETVAFHFIEKTHMSPEKVATEIAQSLESLALLVMELGASKRTDISVSSMA